MESSPANGPNIVEIYARYRDIISRNDHEISRDVLNMLSKSLESRWQMRDAIFCDLSKLMSCLDLSVDSRQFNCLYDFVFFICRKEGQKNITVSRAIAAWRLVLTGRFRLLNQWCSYVEEHQRHNISEDTWQQLLAFSRCVNEDLEGYDPKGSWPVLIDDFVEHMYRISKCSSCGNRGCSCGDMEAPGITTTFSGLNLLPGSKRKSVVYNDWHNVGTSQPVVNSSNSVHMMRLKRLKQNPIPKMFDYRDSDLDMGVVDGIVDSHTEVNRHNSRGCLQTSASVCAVNDSLSKGFEGHLSIGCCFQFDQNSRLSYI
ncbi:uncharacterized protein M6B38_331770 [Iris pallida]|uniref:Defective in cullin neddylation protein n=1 Tax=Iris pallida TaxID=29817 RepID=A0AAX6H4F2_IRIPA|nr:uncharacterized protein M6B38_331770 [Iris pallida]